MSNKHLLRAEIKDRGKAIGRSLAESKMLLHESEEQFRILADSIPNLAWWADSDGYLTWYNRRWYEYTGTTPEQMEGWGWQSVHDPAVLPKVLKKWQESIASGQPFEMEFPLRGADGVFRTFLTRVLPFKNSSGQIVRWFGTNTDVSALKQVEQQLRESESLYRGIGESIDYGVWVCAPDGRNIYASESFLNMVGITQEQCSNFGWGNVLHPDDAERTIAAWQECVKTGGKWDIEHRFRCVDGQWRYVLARGVPIKNENGEITCWAGINLDITERKAIEEALLKLNEELESRVIERTKELEIALDTLLIESNERIQAMETLREKEAEKEQYYKFFQTSADLMAIADPNGAFLKINPACTEILGYTEAELVAKPFIDFVHTLDKQKTLDEMAKQIQSGYSLNFENRYVCKDGSVKWLSWRATYIEAEGITYATARDITEQKQQVETIRRSEREFRLLAEAMPQIVWVTSRDGQNVYFNQKWVDYTGLTLEDSYGDGWNKPFHPEDQQRAWDAWQKATKHGTTYALECRLRRADGIYKWWLIRGVPVLDDGGTILKWFGTCTDINELKQVEAQLLQSKVAAEAANIAKSQFLANMSHEIRTPMNGVIGMAQLLELSELTEEQRGYVNVLKMSGKSLLSLINNILDLSKIEAGKVTIDYSEFSLIQSIKDIANMQELILDKKGLVLDLDLSDEIPPVLIGDQLRVKQVLMNLLGNAVKFTDQGNVTISARLLEHNEESVLIQIEVRDNGIGISAEALDEIFKPFTQEDGSITRKYGGTGLGLTISRHLVKLMGGNISVESIHGSGSCFRVILPFLTVKGDVATHEPPLKTMACWDGPPLRILLAENDRTNIVFATSLLKKLGLDAIAVENGRECLETLEQGDFDIVLMDIHMPVMNGEEALMEIRRKERGTSSHQTVIALTAYALQGDRNRFLGEGFDGYLSKPLETSELITELKRVTGTAENAGTDKKEATHG